VRADIERAILDRVQEYAGADKTWGGSLAWRDCPSHRSNTCLELVAPILIGGASRSGFQARLNARSDMPQCDVHAQLELWCPEIERYLHFERAEWRPNRPHSNPQSAPTGLRGNLLQDRHHPLRLNRRLGISALLQTVTLIGEPLPPGLETFTHFADFLSTVWGIDASQLPSPKWQERLI
jgi:hypothetical protein